MSCNPGDRRHRQGPPRQGDRRARRRHGARRRCGGDPVAHAERQQGSGGARDARAGGSHALQGVHPPRAREPAEPHAVPAGVRRSHRRERRRCAASSRVTGIEFRARAVVLTVGTFLGGRIHVGLDNYSGGRAGDPPSNKLAERLRALPFRTARLKTGTPPRIDGRTIDYSQLADAALRRAAPGVQLSRPRRAIIPRSCPATSRRPRSARTRSSAPRPIARRCSPARSKAWARATARASKTRWFGSPTRPRTRSSSSPKA